MDEHGIYLSVGPMAFKSLPSRNSDISNCIVRLRLIQSPYGRGSCNSGSGPVLAGSGGSTIAQQQGSFISIATTFPDGIVYLIIAQLDLLSILDYVAHEIQ